MKLIKTRPIFLFLLVTISLYALGIAPYQLEISKFFRSYFAGFHSLRLAHITDLHTKGLGPVEKKMIASLNAQKPDVIVITGDVSTPNCKTQGYEEVLRELHAPMGGYFIPGNWEYWNPIKGLVALFKKYNITDLTNKRFRLHESVELIGFDDIVYIALIHSPISLKKITNQVQLSLAGHSHGGHVRLPLRLFCSPELPYIEISY